MTKPKIKYQQKELSDEEIKQKRQVMEGLKMTVDALELQLEMDGKMLALDLPTRKLKAQIKDTEIELERTKNTIKVFEKQIRTKKEKFSPAYT